MCVDLLRDGVKGLCPNILKAAEHNVMELTVMPEDVQCFGHLSTKMEILCLHKSVDPDEVQVVGCLGLSHKIEMG